MKGIITNIQRYSLNDGQGIRTIAFFKGCPLSCRRCANPETQRAEPQVMFHAAKCIDCGVCRVNCPQKLALPAGIDHARCVRCSACARVCPTAAVELTGKEMTVDEILAVVERDRLFYSAGGGLTLSGGEPLDQWRFAAALAQKTSEIHHLHVALETTGSAKWEHLSALAEHCDEILYDIKHMDDRKHRDGTGIGNELILQNLKKLALGAAWKIRIRVPLIEGYNADADNIGKVRELGKALGIQDIHLLPYHEFGVPKYAKLGWGYNFDGKTPDDETVGKIRFYLEENGFTVKVGG